MAGYKYIGKRIYYLKVDGRVVLDTGEAEGWVVENPHELQKPPMTKKEYDFKIYAELQKYNPEEVDFIELKWGEFKTEFAECTSYRVNVDTKQLEFDYTPVPPSPEVPVAPSLHERVDNLELGAEATQEALDMLLLASMGEPVQAATLAVSTFANIKQKGVDNMAAYIAMRIIKKGDKSVEAGREYYVTWMTHPVYSKFKADVDLILQAEERENLIVESL